MLRVAIIGCGKIADQHVQAIQRIPGSQVVAVCDQERLMAGQLAERFGCVSMTLEMPFKDNFDLPDEVYGWSPERSKYLASACLDALHATLPELKKKG